MHDVLCQYKRILLYRQFSFSKAIFPQRKYSFDTFFRILPRVFALETNFIFSILVFIHDIICV